jgi:hypothetical protein
MSLVLAVVANRLVQLELIPTVIDKNISFEFGLLISVHREASRLRQAIDGAWVGVKSAALLHLAKAYSTSGFIGIVIIQDLINAMVILIELRKCRNGTVRHGTIEAICLPCGTLPSHPVKVSLDGGQISLKLLAICVPDKLDLASRHFGNFFAILLLPVRFDRFEKPLNLHCEQ